MRLAYYPENLNKRKPWEIYGITENFYHRIISNKAWVNPEYKKNIVEPTEMPIPRERINIKRFTHSGARLTWDQVEEIRTNHVSKGIMKRKPWDFYGISEQHYYNILSNKSWFDPRYERR